MSAISLRPLIQSVSGTAMSAITIGASLATTLISSSLSSLNSAEREVFERSANSAQNHLPNVLLPVSALRSEYQAHKQKVQAAAARTAISGLTTMKAVTLASVAASPYFTADPKTVQQHLEKVCRAQSVAELQQAESVALAALESGHQQLFFKSLALACSRASTAVGFSSVQITDNASGQLRVIATDESGRSLITEINVDTSKDPSIATEVVGVFDGSCNGILDAFDKALETEGVRASVTKRKFTGGVCELEATRKFVRSKVKNDASDKAATTQAATASRRSQQLNQKAVQKR